MLFQRKLTHALIISWVVLSGIGILVLLAACLVPPDELLDLADLSRLPHDHCAFCGMTRGFLRIGAGDVHAATAENRASAPLFLALAANGFASLFYGARWVLRTHRTDRGRSALPKRPRNGKE